MPASPVPRLTLSTAQQAQLRDSLLTLPVLRRALRDKARVCAAAGRAYDAALDSLQLASEASQAEAAHLKVARTQDARLLASQTAKTAKYRARAHRKGALNVLLSALVAGLLYGLLTK